MNEKVSETSSLKGAILFIVPRYHTNMIPLIDGLQKFGYQTYVIARRTLKSEDHSLVKPIVIKSNKVSQADAEKLISEIRPKYIIIRELKYGFSRISTAGTQLGALSVYYEQWPVFYKGIRGFIQQFYVSIYKKIYSAPKTRITPVLGNTAGKLSKNTYFVPLPGPVLNTKTRSYFLNNRLAVLCVGKLSMPRKRHVWLIRALDELGLRCQLFIVGSGGKNLTNRVKNKYYNTLFEMINASKNKDNIKVLKNLSYKALQKLYLKCDVFVLPSKNEPFGMSPVEAMSAGCAVVCSDTNGSSGYITHKKDGIIFKTNCYNDFKKNLEYVLTSRSRVQSLGQEAYKSILSNYNYDRCIGDLLAALKKADRAS